MAAKAPARASQIRRVSPWRSALLPPPPPAAFTAWAAAINKSISTRWITFIRLGDCYPEELESRLMGKLILQ